MINLNLDLLTMNIWLALIIVSAPVLIATLGKQTLEMMGSYIAKWFERVITNKAPILSRILSQLPFFFFLLLLISLTVIFSLNLPRSVVNFGDNTYIKYDKIHKTFAIFKDGEMIFEHSPSGYGKSVIRR